MLAPQSGPALAVSGVQTSALRQNFYVNNGQLVVYGDQLGYGYGDTITIDVNGAYGVYVNLNGQAASFGYGQITSVVVNTGAGYNSVYVNNEVYNVPLTINDGGNDYVRIGANGSVQGIWGSVSINNPSYYTNLAIDDSADLYGRTAYVNSTYVSGLSPAPIYFHYNDLSYLTVFGGSGGNTFNVYNTPSTYTGSSAGYTYIASGTGIDTVNVLGTVGGPYAGGLYVNGQSGHDYVYVGSAPWSRGYGSLAGINGFVYAYNPSGVTSLSIDDSADTTSRTATLTSSGLAGLSNGPIYWVPTSTYYGGVEDLHIYGSAAGSTYNVTDTPNLWYYTDLNTGTGNDTVNITGTTGYISTYNRGGYDSVYVGNGTLAGINGSVYASGAGSTYLYIQDANEQLAHQSTLTSYGLFGMSTGAIWWAASSTAMGGVTYLRIASSVGSIVTVADTPNLLYWTDLNTGDGSQVNVNGTTGTLNVNAGLGFQSVYVGNGTLANINGNVNVSGTGFIYLYVNDANDATAHTVTLTASSLTGLSRGAIRWVSSPSRAGGVTILTIEGSAAGSTYLVTDTPNLYSSTQLDTGSGDDRVFITATTSPLYLYNNGGSDTVVIGSQAPATAGGTLAAIKGFVDIYGLGTIALTVDDSGDTTGRNVTLTGTGITGLAPAAIYYDPNIATVTINAGSGNDTLVGPSTYNYWLITGADAGNINDAVFFSNVENLVGGTDVDTFFFEAGAQAASINGGGAPAGQGDWLDYTFSPEAVSVNLATGIATDVTGTVSNIQNVRGGNHGNTLTGSAQGNILIGGDAADTLIGGSGRSLLIGGRGNDTIVGGADDDVVIGGYTNYDSPYNASLLMSLLSRWQSADSYATRVYTLQNTWRPLSPGRTVHDDGDTDLLTGGAGMDWFISGTNGTVTDYQAGEKVS